MAHPSRGCCEITFQANKDKPWKPIIATIANDPLVQGTVENNRAEMMDARQIFIEIHVFQQI